MKRKLDILVTQYKEPDLVVKPLLDSIELQVGVNKDDFRVIIVNDGSDVFLSDELLGKYSYEIKYVKAEHGGISKARNNAMDEAESEYVMFCDCDDMFFNMFGLRMIFEEINRVNELTGHLGFDVLNSLFEEEVGEGCQEIEHHRKDSSFIHGKVYNLNFLKQNGIRWKDDVYCHEDVYFNCLALNISEYTTNLDTAFYLWRYRKGSITRSDNVFEVDTFPELVKSFSYLIDDLLERQHINGAKINATSGIFRFYLFMNKITFSGHEKECECLIAKFWKKYKFLYDKTSKEDKIKLMIELKKSFLESGLLFEKITFDDWIKHLEEL